MSISKFIFQYFNELAETIMHPTFKAIVKYLIEPNPSFHSSLVSINFVEENIRKQGMQKADQSTDIPEKCL